MDGDIKTVKKRDNRGAKKENRGQGQCLHPNRQGQELPIQSLNSYPMDGMPVPGSTLAAGSFLYCSQQGGLVIELLLRGSKELFWNY